MAKHQETVSAGSRLYYFDVRESPANGEDYITITEMNTRTKQLQLHISLYPENIDRKFRGGIG